MLKMKLIERLKKLLKLLDIHSVSFVWVKGHAGHKYNERCDTLAVAASKKENLKLEVV